MPSMGNMPDVDNAALLDDLGDALAFLADHEPEYQRRQNYYDGNIKEIITHPDIEKLLARYSDEFRLNYAAVPADAINDRIDLAGVVVPEDDTLTAKLRDDLWTPNQLDDDADDYHLKACYLGDYYAISWPKPDENGQPSQVIELFGKHPRSAAILYDRENDRVVRLGVYRWKKGKGWRVNLYYDDAIMQFIAENSTGDKAEQYAPYVDLDEPDDDGSIENPWGFPMHHYRVDSKPYGTPVNLKAYGAQDAITKINATEMGWYDYHGYPQRWATLRADVEAGDDIAEDFNDDGTVDPDIDPALLNEGTRNESTGIIDERSSKLKNAPGSTWLLKGVENVGEFENGTNESLLNGKSGQIKAAATLTRTPLYEFDLEAGGDQPSGEARRRADGPINKHATKVKGSFGRTWQSVGLFALRVWGLGADKKPEAAWLPSELATDKEGMELVEQKIKNGVPVKVALVEAGWTSEAVDEWFPDNVVQVTPALLTLIATALQTLGQAKTLNAISDANIVALLPAFLKGPRPPEGIATPPAPAPQIIPAVE